MSLLKLHKMEYSEEASQLQKIRQSTLMPLPLVLQTAPFLELSKHEALGAVNDHEDIEKAFPKTYGRARVALEKSSVCITNPIRIGVVLSGGQAPGGHNVIAGIYDYIKKVSKDSSMIGFLDGPHGVYSGRYCIVDDAMMDKYRNSGGFDMIGSGRHKIEKPEEFANAMKVCIELNLDGVVVIGGDDSNTNAAVLAEYFEANNCKTKVCGAPKTIDGDLKVENYIPISFGFDTATRVYSELIGNLARDTLSSQKYYHFVRLMGRAASNIALECALQTRPNICLISEEVEAKKMTLAEITKQVVDVILKRSEDGKDYGLVLLPEGLIEFIPEFNHLINEINDVLATGVETTEAAVSPLLSKENQAVFAYLPKTIKEQLLLDRDPHGNVQVAKIETERLLAETVSNELAILNQAGKYNGNFMPQFHSYGYEGRSGLPSDFDSIYCYILGYNVAALISLGQNGLISSVTNINAPVSEWKCGGVPITMMCHMEKRHGHMKPVIKKALVELDQEPFKCFVSQRGDWALYDLYRSPGPVQFFLGSQSVDLCITLTLELTKKDSRMSLTDIEAAKTMLKKNKRLGSFNHSALIGPALEGIQSNTQKMRKLYKADLCPPLASRNTGEHELPTQCRNPSDRAFLSKLFPATYGSNIISFNKPKLSDRPVKIGVVFSGRQGPGVHDVVAGIFDSLSPGSTLIGFVGGIDGLVANYSTTLTAEVLEMSRGKGGNELLGRSREYLDVSEYSKVKSTCEINGLDGLVLIGGARTATITGDLSEYFSSSKLTVVCVPADPISSLKNEFVETTIGFDTTSKIAGQIVGNNATDGASAKKYYYFMRLIGQEPSHISLEVGLATNSNYILLSEEAKAKNMTLADIVRSIADVIVARANAGKNYGTVIIPEGLVDVIPELKLLNTELDQIYAEAKASNVNPSNIEVRGKLTVWSQALLSSLPDFMQVAVLRSRGTEATLPMSQAETEKLLAHFVDIELAYRKKNGTYKGSFSVICSFIGYQARGAAPSNFDVTYAYNAGFLASSLVLGGFNGYCATINNLKDHVSKWRPLGVPVTAMMTQVNGKGVISKAFVDLNGPAYRQLAIQRERHIVNDSYRNPGPLQYMGPSELVDSVPMTLQLETCEYMENVKILQKALTKIEEACRPGCSQKSIQIVTKSLNTLTDIMELH